LGALSREEDQLMIYERRIYHAMPGRMPDLLKRFQEITLPIWARLGIRQAGFWTFYVGGSNHDLIYLLAWESMAERDRIWTTFQSDPEWLEKRSHTERNGPLISSFSNAFLQPTAFSVVK
jgi:NIPSNAP